MWESRGVRPARTRPENEDVLTYIRNLTNKYGLKLTDTAEWAWKVFEQRLVQYRPEVERRSLRLEPHKQDSITNSFQELHIDVAAAGVDGICDRLYKLEDVTGVDERVQAVVASQVITAVCLMNAMQTVEESNCRGWGQFSFVCHDAMHISVACCLLLAAVAYRNASVYMTTDRTRIATAGLPLRVIC